VRSPFTPGTAMQITTHNTLVRTTGPRSTPREQQTSTSSTRSYTSLDPTLAIMLPRKIRSLREIYNEDTTNSFSSFLLRS
jgi:hypothetical protein